MAKWAVDYTSPIPWTLDSHGPGPKTVYVRFMDDRGTVSDVYVDDIILDVKPPVGAVRVDSQEGSTVVLSLPATDDISTDAEWIPYHASNQQLGDCSDPFHVCYKDRAGNVSQIYSTDTPSRPHSLKVYLPLTIKPSG